MPLKNQQHKTRENKAAEVRKCPDVSDAIERVMNDPLNLHDDDIKSLEAFIIFMYTNKRDDEDINHVRKVLFCQKGRSIEHNPPTKAALIQHIRHGCICWGQCIIANQQLPCPSELGWTKGTTWQPHWTDASTTCRDLLKCNCKSNCAKKFRCRKAGMDCIELCSCGGNCTVHSMV
jgi:hypothetical protein